MPRGARPCALVGAVLALAGVGTPAVATAPRAVLDAHVHLTNLSQLQYTWQASLPKLNRSWTAGDLAAAAHGSLLRPAEAVFIEVSAIEKDWVKEMLYVQDLAGKLALRPELPQIRAIVGHVALEAGAGVVEPLLDRLQAEVPLFRGVREGESASFLRNASFVDGVCALGRRGLEFDVLAGPSRFPDVAALADACPGTRLVLDHMGSPAIEEGPAGFAAWAPALRELARRPNIYVKVSGAPGEAARGVYGNWSVAEVAPFIQTSVRAFGWERSLFAGNWFFLNLAGNYTGWADAVHQSLGPLHPSESDLRRFYNGTATEAYGIRR